MSRDLVRHGARPTTCPQEECGILGLSTPNGDGVAQLAFFGLFALQHRGQEAAGLAVSDGRRVRVHKQPGLVSNVFTREALAPLVGYHAIGHTRYSTTGGSSDRNIQPFVVETMHGPLALAHNGNIVNTASLREELLSRGFGLTASSDSEVMTLMLAAAGGQTWEDRIERTLPAWKGAFSLVLLCGDRVLAVRDPWGFRPLSVGRLPHGGYAVASETCALATLGCTDISEVAPGEIVTLQGTEIHRRQALTPASRGRPLHVRVRLLLPARLGVGRAQHAPRARGARRRAGPRVGRRRRRGDPGSRLLDPGGDRLRPGERRAVQRRADQEPLHRAHVHRADPGDPPSAASPSSTTRCRRTSRGRRVVMIDDSLVRGTTAGPLVKLVRDAGATEVHVRITCPPIIHPCHFGVDMGHDGDLMSARLTVDETRERIGADSLAFLSLEGMMRAIGYDDVATAGYCNACYTGDYPIAVADAHAKLSFEGVLA